MFFEAKMESWEKAQQKKGVSIDMIEQVNKNHPDKKMDCVCGAIVDLAYRIQENPKIAVEGLMGHGYCKLIIESSIPNDVMENCISEIYGIVDRIAGMPTKTEIIYTSQDSHLAENPEGMIRCGDNGVFKGVPITEEQKKLSRIVYKINEKYPYDGKCILDGDKLIICQSNAPTEELRKMVSEEYPKAIINPLGDWTGGTMVDTGAVNRKLGSDMGDSVTGGGLHGKDLSKADVSVNIYAFLKAQEIGNVVQLSCAIGNETVDGMSYAEIVEIARDYIQSIGGFEKFAEWGLIRCLCE